MKASGAGSVMADRARGEVETDDAQRALYRKLEFFPTPPWAGRAGGELIQRIDPGPWWAWEPACGQGHMAHGLGDYFERVLATDIHAHGPFQHGDPVDFLADDADRFGATDWIVTNPPFVPAAQFVEVGLRRAARGVAILARASWYETIGRYGLFYGDTRLTLYAPFFERVPMTLGEWKPDASTATAYAWFVFMHPRVLPDWMRQLRAVDPLFAVTTGIAPGTRERLTRPDDARRFAVRAPAPLFGEN